MRAFPSIFSPFSAEIGGVSIPYAFAIHSGPTLRMPYREEAIHQGINGIKVGKGLYQIDGKLSEGGMGVTYHARLHSTQENTTPDELKHLPSRAIIKEMTFQVPEMLLTRATAEMYVKNWRLQRLEEDGLEELIMREVPWTFGKQRRVRAEENFARTMRKDILDTITEPDKKQRLAPFLPQDPSTKEELFEGLEQYYAEELKRDILTQIPGAERKHHMEVMIAANQQNNDTIANVLEHLVAFSQTPEARELRKDLERQKAEFLREVAVLKILEESHIEHIPQAIGGLIRLSHKKDGMKDIVNLFFAQTEMPGEPLSTFLRKPDKSKGDPGQMFTEKYAVKAMIKYLRILEQIHEAGFIYRDGKPENTLFDVKTGEISIVDFGIAVPVDDKVIKRMRSQGIITDAIAQGTLGYYPPEATRHLPIIEERGDTFSAAKLLYALLTAELQPDDNPVVFINEQLIPSPEISRPLKAIIAKAVAPRYEERYTPAQFREQLENHLDHITRRI